MTEDNLALRERAALAFVGAVGMDAVSALTFSVCVGNPQLNGFAALSVLGMIVFTGASIALAKNLQSYQAP